MGTDDRAHAVGIAAAFVAGAMDARAFEQLLYRDVAPATGECRSIVQTA